MKGPQVPWRAYFPKYEKESSLRGFKNTLQQRTITLVQNINTSQISVIMHWRNFSNKYRRYKTTIFICFLNAFKALHIINHVNFFLDYKNKASNHNTTRILFGISFKPCKLDGLKASLPSDRYIHTHRQMFSLNL